jgi:hypothetical protein
MPTPVALTVPCPAPTQASVVRALRRAGEVVPYRLSCPPGRVTLDLDLDAEPHAHAEVSAAHPDEAWIGTALVRIAHVRRLGFDPDATTSDARPPSSQAEARAVDPTPVPARPSELVRPDAHAPPTPLLPARWAVRAFVERTAGTSAPRIEAAGLLGQWELGPSAGAVWNGTALGVVRGQLLAWTVGRPIPLPSPPGCGLEVVPRVSVGAVRLAATASESSTAASVAMKPVAEAALDVRVRPTGNRWPVSLGLRVGERAGPTATAAGVDALALGGFFAGLGLAWEGR